MIRLFKYSVWIYLILFGLVVYWALLARKKILPAEEACSRYSQGQAIIDYDDEMAQLASEGALVKIKAGDSQTGTYPIIEIYASGETKPHCRLHIENQNLIFIERAPTP